MSLEPTLILLLATLLQEPVEHPHFGGYPAQDALSYAIGLRLDPAEEHVDGSCAYRFRALEELSSITLDSVAGPNWEIDFFDADGVALAAEREGGRLRVDLGRTVAAGEELTFEARFSGRPPDGLLFQKTRHGQPVAFTDHFSIRARGWLPCEDHPADRALFRLAIEAPVEYEVVSSGAGAYGPARASDPDEAADWRTWTAATEVTMSTYLLALAVAPFARLAEDGDERLVPHYLYKKDLPRARRALKHHARWIEIMEETFGPYDYSKYCVVQVPTRWGGMENAGNTWINEALFDYPRFGVATLAHELAHQWFGDAVSYAEWHESWLSEGFASYFGPWLDAQTGGPDLRGVMGSIRKKWLESRAGRAYPVRWREYEAPDEFFYTASRNTYEKGAWVLHMLRGEIGDEAFFGGIRDYYQSHRGEAVTTEALLQKMEEASGEELDWFFDQWLERAGCPELRFAWDGSGVTVTQTQGGDPYRFQLTLQWRDAERVEQRRRFRITERETRLELGEGLSVPEIDPDLELLFRKMR